MQRHDRPRPTSLGPTTGCSSLFTSLVRIKKLPKWKWFCWLMMLTGNGFSYHYEQKFDWTKKIVVTYSRCWLAGFLLVTQIYPFVKKFVRKKFLPNSYKQRILMTKLKMLIHSTDWDLPTMDPLYDCTPLGPEYTKVTKWFIFLGFLR